MDLRAMDDQAREWFAARDPELRTRLSELYWPWVQLLARNFHRRIPSGVLLDADALAAEGVFGLLRAVERFEPARGIRFSTFAASRITGAFRDALRSVDWVPRLARRRGEETRAILSMDSCTAEALAVTEPAAAAPPDEADWERWLTGCNDRERHLLLGYYRDGLRMRDIGRQLGLSESRVSQLHSAIMRRLRTVHARPLSTIEPDQEAAVTDDPAPPPPVPSPTSAVAFLAALSIEQCEEHIARHESELAAWRALRTVVLARDRAAETDAPPVVATEAVSTADGPARRGQIRNRLISVLRGRRLTRMQVNQALPGLRPQTISGALARFAVRDDSGYWELRSNVDQGDAA